MEKRIVSFFLLWFLYSVPANAMTIVNVSEALTVVEIEYLSDCEWIEMVETRTTTTYQEWYPAGPGVFTSIPPSGQPRLTYTGFHNPCFPDPEDKDAVIPDYCFAPLQTVNPISGSGYLAGYFREWSDVQLNYSTIYFHNCDDNCGSDSGGGGTGDSTGGIGNGTGENGGGTGGGTGGTGGTGQFVEVIFKDNAGGTGGTGSNGGSGGNNDTSGYGGDIGGTIDAYTATATTVPEPGTLGLLGIGLVLVGLKMKKEKG